jgi:hypothetical protein
MAFPQFEKFRRSAVTAASVPIVAIHKRKLFAMNQLAYELIGEPEAVELFYAPFDQVIGIRPASRESPDAYVVRHHTRFSHQVEGKSFMSFYDIPDEVTGRRYKAELLDNVLAVNLKQKPEEPDGRG